MRVSRKAMLHCSRERIRDPGKEMPRTGNRLDQIRDDAAGHIVFQDKPLLSLFDMDSGRGVQETKTSGGINSFCDAAEVDGPDKRRVGLHSNQFACNDRRALVGYAHPPQIELLPSQQRFTSSAEDAFTISQPAPRQVVSKARRRRTDDSAV